MRIRLVNLSQTSQLSTSPGLLAPLESTIFNVDTLPMTTAAELDRLVAAGVLHRVPPLTPSPYGTYAYE